MLAQLCLHALSNTQGHTSNPGAQRGLVLPATARSQMASSSSEACHMHGPALLEGLCSCSCASPAPGTLSLHSQIQVAALIA